MLFLGAFLVLLGARDVHANLSGHQETTCELCKIAHHSPIALDASTNFTPQWSAMDLFVEKSLPSLCLTVIEYPGRSPPTL